LCVGPDVDLGRIYAWILALSVARYLVCGPILGLLAAGPGMTVLPLSVMIEKVLSPGLVVLVDR
jgi:hypothetical protein